MESLLQSPLLAQYGPDMVYLALIAGLWLAITAVYVPGTGGLELGALVVGALAVGGLFLVPPNIGGIVLLMLAAGCFLALIPFRRLWPLIVAGLACQVLGSVFLFPVGSRPSPWAMVILNGAALAYHQLILMPGLRIQERARQVGPETLIGALGEVIRTLEPQGTIRIEGTMWAARTDGVIESGHWVRVVGRSGLELLVEPAQPEHVFPAGSP